MIRRNLKSSAIYFLIMFFVLTQNISAQASFDNYLDYNAMKKTVDMATDNIELTPNVFQLSTIELYRDIIAKIHICATNFIKKKEASQEFYGIASYFVAIHFKRYTLAKNILIEERRYATDLLLKSWIDGELLMLEKINLIMHTKKQSNNLKIKPPIFKSSFELFKRLTQKTNIVLYSENQEHTNNRNLAMLAELIRDEAEQLASEGKLQNAVQKFDLSSNILANISNSKSSLVATMIMSARSIADMGLNFQAIVRYKMLLLQDLTGIEPIIKSVIYEDIADIYSRMKLNTKASLFYHKALQLIKNKKKSTSRLLIKLGAIEG